MPGVGPSNSCYFGHPLFLTFTRFRIQNDAFQSLSEITGKAWEDTDNGITKEMWKEGLALTAFDCDPTTANDFRYLGLPKQGHTRLTLKLKNS